MLTQHLKDVSMINYDPDNHNYKCMVTLKNGTIIALTYSGKIKRFKTNDPLDK